ncbi:MAG: LapA family protein [bacterium]|nr:LapA family protein [bacterium]MBU1919164.1 LapA family protein [bacterium]
MLNFKLVLTIITLIFVVIFTLQNAEIVPIKFLLWGFSLSRALVIFLFLAIGVIIGWFLHASLRKTKENNAD